MDDLCDTCDKVKEAPLTMSYECPENRCGIFRFASEQQLIPTHRLAGGPLRIQKVQKIRSDSIVRVNEC
jgi:hypothetical protein